MRLEHFRGVVWPHPPVTEGIKTNYRYVIVGMLVTDKPLDVPENESVIDGFTGIADVIEGAVKRQPNIPVGDATNVLLNLAVL
jgi:hypothetical protein